MDQFRLILALIGIALLLLVYFVSRRSNAKNLNSKTEQLVAGNRHQIPMSGDVSPPERPCQAAMEEANIPQRKSRKRYVKFLSGSKSSHSKTSSHAYQETRFEPLTVVIYVMPLPGISFRREQVMRCLESMGCVPRRDAGFDYVVLDKSENKMMHRLFKIDDAHEPGVFSQLPGTPEKTNALVFEMQLPGPIDSVAAFEKLLEIARVVATKLNGVVCDDLRNRLTKQATTHIKDRILDHSRRMRFNHSSSLQ